MAKSKGLRWALGVLKVTLIGTAVILVSAGIAYRLTGLQKSALASGTDVSQRRGIEDRALFFDLLAGGVLMRRTDGGIRMKPSDYILIQRAEGDEADKGKDKGKVDRETQARLINQLYHQSVGTIIRQQVRLWNESRRIAGIRDDRPQSDEERKIDKWRAYSPSGHPLATASLVPESFGFIHGDKISVGFSRWQTVSSQTDRVTFRSRIKVSSPRTIEIQVVGEPVKGTLPPGAKVERREDKEYERKLLWPCRIATRAAVVRVPVRPSRRGQLVSITVAPAVNCAPRIYGLAISMAPDDRKAAIAATKKYQRDHRRWTRRKRGDEPRPPEIKWVYHWRPVKRSVKTETRFTIKTADGVYLTDPSGKKEPTDAAYKLGLVNLVGFGPTDANSLMGMLSKSRIPQGGLDVTLTIDSRIQAIAQSTVNYYLGTVFPKMSGNRFADQRKNAVVILDADTGALLAVAGWPLPPRDASAWDYTSFGVERPLRDPMSIFAWEVIDRHNTPGSTMKPLLSLALMRAHRPRLNRIMRGLSPGELQAETGLNPSTGTYTISEKQSISNFGNTPLARYFNSTSRNLACAKAPQPKTMREVCTDMNAQNCNAFQLQHMQTVGHFGLKQAVQFSINMWFARLAVMLEERDIELFTRKLRADVKAKRAPKQLKKLPDTRLMKSLRLVGINDEKRMDLGVNVPKRLGLFRLNTPNGADILYSQKPRTHISSGEPVDTWNPASVKIAYTHRIALNGIGQGWSVSPLHMARGAASVASSRRIQPFLIKKWGDLLLPVPPAPKLPIDHSVLSVLRLGMKAVTEAPGSTAVGTFAQPPLIVNGKTGKELAPMAKKLAAVRADLKCRAYGKTGTADVGKGLGYNSGWFIGWKDPLKRGGRRLAYACMTTHVLGGFRFGGTSCGRIIRDILTSVELLQASETTPAPRAQPGPKARPNGPQSQPPPIAPPRAQPGRAPGSVPKIAPRIQTPE